MINAWRITDLTCDELIRTLSTRREMLPPSEALAIDIIRKGSRLDKIEIDGAFDAIPNAIEQWLATDEPRQAVPRACDIATRGCDQGAVTAAVEMGINPWGLLLISQAIGGVASVERWEGQDATLASLVMDIKDDTILLPLASGILWGGDRMMIADDRLPATLVTASIGRKAGDIVSHPLAEGSGEILNIVEETDGWYTMKLKGRPARWGDLAEIGVGQGIQP